MKILSFFVRKRAKEENGRFSDFFINGTLEEKKRLLTDAAKKANKDQRETYQKSNLKFREQN